MPESALRPDRKQPSQLQARSFFQAFLQSMLISARKFSIQVPRVVCVYTCVFIILSKITFGAYVTLQEQPDLRNRGVLLSVRVGCSPFDRKGAAQCMYSLFFVQ
jgi:hypothetical protein